MFILKGRGLVPGKAKGRIIKLEKAISPLGDIDPDKGLLNIKDTNIELKGKILFLPYTIGSTVGAYVFYSLSKKSIAPAAIVAEKADITLLSGCIISKIPLIDGIRLKDVDGTVSEVDGSSGEVKIY